MKENEVGAFYKYIQDLYRLPGIETTDAFDDWCEAFKNITFEQGKNIVKAYGRANTDKPTLPMLTKFRDSLYPPTGREGMKVRCDLCNSSGVIFVEKEIVTNERFPDNCIIEQFAYRCTCDNGTFNFSAFPQINNDIVRGKFRDISNVWRVHEPKMKHGDKRPIDTRQSVRQLKNMFNDNEF